MNPTTDRRRSLSTESRNQSPPQRSRSVKWSPGWNVGLLPQPRFTKMSVSRSQLIHMPSKNRLKKRNHVSPSNCALCVCPCMQSAQMYTSEDSAAPESRHYGRGSVTSCCVTSNRITWQRSTTVTLSVSLARGKQNIDKQKYSTCTARWWTRFFIVKEDNGSHS